LNIGRKRFFCLLFLGEKPGCAQIYNHTLELVEKGKGQEALFGVADSAGLTNHNDPDLSGVG
jgi:hypothetical protein